MNLYSSHELTDTARSTLIFLFFSAVQTRICLSTAMRLSRCFAIYQAGSLGDLRTARVRGWLAGWLACPSWSVMTYSDAILSPSSAACVTPTAHIYWSLRLTNIFTLQPWHSRQYLFLVLWTLRMLSRLVCQRDERTFYIISTVLCCRFVRVTECQ
jgi:hypothetical protein